MAADAHDIAAVPAVILAGGLATRLRPISEKIPKALVDLAGRPFIDWQLDLLAENGVRRIVMCLGHLGEMVRDHCGDGAARGMQIRYSFDGPTLMGTGGAIRRAADAGLLPADGRDPFWVMYGDSYMDIDYGGVLRAFAAAPHADGLMTVLRNDGKWDTSNVVFEGGRLVKYSKRDRSPAMRYIDYGVGVLRAAALGRVPGDRPHDLAELYAALVDEGRMIGYEVTNRFYEIGTPASLEEARLYLQARKSH